MNKDGGGDGVVLIPGTGGHYDTIAALQARVAELEAVLRILLAEPQTRVELGIARDGDEDTVAWISEKLQKRVTA